MKIIKIFMSGIAVFLVVVLTAVVCGIFYFTNGFSEDLKFFYIENNNNKVFSKTDSFVLKENEQQEFIVVYVFDKITSTISTDYSVEIVANGGREKSFDIRASGKTLAFYAMAGFEKAFNVVKGEKSFTIDFSGGLKSILQKYFETTDVVVSEPKDFYEFDYFKMIVWSHNKNSKIEVDFRLFVPVSGIEIIDKEVIF